MYVYIHVGAYVCECVCVCRLKVDVGSLPGFLPYALRHDLSLSPELPDWLSSLASELWICLSVCLSLTLGLQIHQTQLLCGCWESMLMWQAFLSTEPSPQLQTGVFDKVF